MYIDFTDFFHQTITYSKLYVHLIFLRFLRIYRYTRNFENFRIRCKGVRESIGPNFWHLDTLQEIYQDTLPGKDVRWILLSHLSDWPKYTVWSQPEFLKLSYYLCGGLGNYWSDDINFWRQDIFLPRKDVTWILLRYLDQIDQSIRYKVNLKFETPYIRHMEDMGSTKPILSIFNTMPLYYQKKTHSEFPYYISQTDRYFRQKVRYSTKTHIFSTWVLEKTYSDSQTFWAGNGTLFGHHFCKLLFRFLSWCLSYIL